MCQNPSGNVGSSPTDCEMFLVYKKNFMNMSNNSLEINISVQKNGGHISSRGRVVKATD